MSFSLDVKTEIFKIENAEECCAKAELAGMLCFGASLMHDGIKLRSEHGIVAERFYRLLKSIYDYEAAVRVTENGIFMIEIKGDMVEKILEDLKLNTVPIRIKDKIAGRECCKTAFVRGAFMGGGSVSNPEKSYHGEMTTSHYVLGGDFVAILEYFGIYPKRLNRNGNYIFYLKDSEQIESLLALIGAHGKMMDFLNVKIEKDLRNNVNRQVNCDTANLDKTVDAAIAQRMAIEKLISQKGMESLSPELIQVAELRLENPEMTLSEMAKGLGLTKSGVNHRMRRIMELSKM